MIVPALVGPTLGLVMLIPPLASAEPPRSFHAAELQRALARLRVVGSVLYIAAHPDDENTTLLSYLNNERLLRTAYLSVTRGDGGQNLIGPEQGELLGLIRTQELLAARRLDGAEQFFTRARDFGFSKTPTETLAIWGRDKVLADVVWVIRKLQPDVVITRFPAQHGEGQHGHHTASAMLAGEAFRAAADPRFHPEQLKYVTPWQARRLVWNKSMWNAKPGENLSAFMKTDIGGFNPFLGLSYGELAAESRSMHKSQGFGVPRSRGTDWEYFQLLEGDRPAQSFLDGIDFSWKRVAGAERLDELLARAHSEFRPEAPHLVIATLLEASAILSSLPEQPWKARKQKELAEVIAACAGLWAEAIAAEPSATPGSGIKLTTVALNRSPAAVTLREVRFGGGESVAVNQALKYDEPAQVERTVTLAADHEVSNPHWLELPPDGGTYTVRDPALAAEPERPPALQVEFVFAVGERTFSLRRPVAYKWTDPVQGERSRPFEVVPPVMINPGASVLMFPDGHSKALRVTLKAGKAEANGVLRLELPEGWSAEPASIPFHLKDKSSEEELQFSIRPAHTSSGTLRAVAEVDGRRLARGVTRIEYPHIPIQTLFPEALVKLVRVDLERTGAHIGYIPGAGDEVAESLRQVGYDVTPLGDEALRSEALGRFDAIVVGVRAYNTNVRLPFHNKRLMDYVANGGHLIVQYNTNNRLSKLEAAIGPHPFRISRDRVTDENAAVTFLDPQHPILHEPNSITAADFAGWVQERGLYFADQWDSHYQTPLAMNDAGEPPQKGSLLVTRHGKGAFIYTGLSFFRQLPAGVPGAYRLFANLIAYGK